MGQAPTHSSKVNRSYTDALRVQAWRGLQQAIDQEYYCNSTKSPHLAWVLQTDVLSDVHVLFSYVWHPNREV